MLDLLIYGGRTVTAGGIAPLDIGVKDGRIVALGLKEYMARAQAEIGAAGKLVFPGLVDPHTHLELPWKNTTTLDDFLTGTRAAAMGGITTLIDFATQQGGELPQDAVAKRQAQAQGKVCIDYSLHLALTDVTAETLDQVPEIVQLGIPSIKSYMTYPEEGVMSDDGDIMALLEKLRELPALWGAHAENAPISVRKTKELLAEGKREAHYHGVSRPPLVEAEAVHRALFLTERAEVPYYNFHLSIGSGVQMIGAARQKGQPVYAETCPRYLLLTEERMQGEDGVNFICTPPLRSTEERDALWQALSDGTISLVSSDEAAYSRQQKAVGKESFHLTPSGLCGFEFTLPLMYTQGVEKGRISLTRLVQLLSTNPAKIFGLFPRKGTIAIGSDADLTIFDPSLSKTLSEGDSAIGSDWLPYAGMTVSGWPITCTIVRGKVVAREGRFVGEEGYGQFLPRKISEAILNNPVV